MIKSKRIRTKEQIKDLKVEFAELCDECEYVYANKVMQKIIELETTLNQATNTMLMEHK